MRRFIEAGLSENRLTPRCYIQPGKDDGHLRATRSSEALSMPLNLKVLPLIALAAVLCATGALAQQSPPKPAMPSGDAHSAMQSSGMDMANMKSEMEKMRAQMEQVQAPMKDTMAKMAAADAAMKTHMETE
jgi:hypothetical protein